MYKILIDIDFISALTHKLVNIAKGPISLIFVIQFLTPEQQGYWFFITNMGAILYMADFGLSLLTMQIIAKNTFNSTNNFPSRNCFKELINATYGFIAKSIFILSMTIIPISIYLLRDADSTVRLAWALYLMSAIFVQILFLELSVIQGLGRISLAFGFRSIFSFFSLFFCVILLFQGSELSALGLANILAATSSIFALVWITKKQEKPRVLPRDIRNLELISTSMKRKYIVSWIAGYCMFFLIIPITLHYQGPVEAGKLGICLAFVKALSAISLAPLDANITKLSSAYGRNNKIEFDYIFKKSLIYGLVLFLLGSVSLILLLAILSDFREIGERLPNLSVLIFVLLAELIYLLISIISKKIRIFLIEPFSILNLVFALLVVCCAMYNMAYFNVQLWSIIQAAVYLLFGLPAFYYVYRKNCIQF